jgi:hypothetical protein
LPSLPIWLNPGLTLFNSPRGSVTTLTLVHPRVLGTVGVLAFDVPTGICQVPALVSNTPNPLVNPDGLCGAVQVLQAQRPSRRRQAAEKLSAAYALWGYWSVTVTGIVRVFVPSVAFTVKELMVTSCDPPQPLRVMEPMDAVMRRRIISSR